MLLGVSMKNDVWLVKYSIFENSQYSYQDSRCVFFL